MTRIQKRRVALLLVFLMILAMPVSAEASGRGVYYRPSLTFITQNAPDDLLLHMDLNRGGETVSVYLYREDRLWESYFRFYHQTATNVPNWHGSRAEFRDAVLVAETGGRETRIPLPEEMQKKLTMNDFFMLDLSDGSLRFGLPMGRAVLLFFLRLVLTLTAALLVLRFFQYRWRRSWAVAGIAHLISQGALSLFVANWVNYNPKMIAVHFMVMLAVLIVQIPVFWWLLDENGSETGVRYAFWSNLATGVLNSVFLIHFPL